MIMNDIAPKLKQFSSWLRTQLTNVIDSLAKIPPRSLASMVIALLTWSALTSVALIVLSGCGSRQVVMQPHKPLPPPPDFLMQNPPTADLIPRHMQGQSARKLKPSFDTLKETAPKPQ